MSVPEHFLPLSGENWAAGIKSLHEWVPTGSSGLIFVNTAPPPPAPVPFSCCYRFQVPSKKITPKTSGETRFPRPFIIAPPSHRNAPSPTLSNLTCFFLLPMREGIRPRLTQLLYNLFAMQIRHPACDQSAQRCPIQRPTNTQPLCIHGGQGREESDPHADLQHGALKNQL